jgi:hypothetical protein
MVGKGIESVGANAVEGAQIVGETAKDAGKAMEGTAEKAVGEIKGIFGGK